MDTFPNEKIKNKFFEGHVNYINFERHRYLLIHKYLLILFNNLVFKGTFFGIIC